jgi:exodeoxyribonuclease VII large subunit
VNAKHVALVNGATKSVNHADAQVKDLARTLSHRAHTATKLHRDTINRLREDLFRNARASLTEAQRNVERNAAFLRGINPVEILARGYGFVKTEEKYIRNVSDLSVGDHLDVTLHDGTISVEVKAVKHEQK